jgi:hypothetical protein
LKKIVLMLKLHFFRIRIHWNKRKDNIEFWNYIIKQVIFLIFI